LLITDRQEAHAATTVLLKLAMVSWIVVIFNKWYVRKKKQTMSVKESEKASPNSQPQKDSRCEYCGELSPGTAENCINCNRPF
jgi:ABC-type Fe3+ transport system permease subunit